MIFIGHWGYLAVAGHGTRLRHWRTAAYHAVFKATSNKNVLCGALAMLLLVGSSGVFILGAAAATLLLLLFIAASCFLGLALCAAFACA